MATGQLGAINDFKCLSPFDGVPHLKKKKHFKRAHGEA